VRRTVLFEISYRDPCCGEIKTIEATFEDTPEITALEWAHNYAYDLAEGGWYKIAKLDSEVSK
jgi:hypothetical protein